VAAKTIEVGDEAGASSRLKLVLNSWIVSLVESLAETIALAEGLGLDPALFFEAIKKGPLDLPYLRSKGQAMADRDFTPAFRLSLAAKDAGLVADAAWQHGLELPLFEVIARRLGQGTAEHGDQDVSATYLTSTPDQAA
jgi:3-hydroxyisobutyrate dehydrogenase